MKKNIVEAKQQSWTLKGGRQRWQGEGKEEKKVREMRDGFSREMKDGFTFNLMPLLINAPHLIPSQLLKCILPRLINV